MAAALARAFPERFGLDVAFAQRAGLLHDVGRCRSHHPILHGIEGYRLLRRRGHRAEALVCIGHLLYAFDPAEAPHIRISRETHFPLTWEERLIPLADFLVEGDRPTTLEARFASLRRRYAQDRLFLKRLAASEAWTRRTAGAFAAATALACEQVARQAL